MPPPLARSLPVVRTGRKLAGVGDRGAGEALEGSRGGVDAQRDAVGVDLLVDEPVEPLLDLGRGRQLALPLVVEVALGRGLEVQGELAQVGPGVGVAAPAHAGVVPEPALVQVRVVERLRHGHALVRVQLKQAQQEVHGVVGGAGAEGVEGGGRRRLGAAAQHVALGRVARVAHVGQAGSAQQVGDQLQLLDRTLSLQERKREGGIQARSAFRLITLYPTCLKEYPPAQEFAEDAPDRPDVHRVGVMPRAHQDLRCPVVLRHHFLSHVLAFVVLLHPGNKKTNRL